MTTPRKPLTEAQADDADCVRLRNEPSEVTHDN